jgi:hypothetical protein
MSYELQPPAMGVPPAPPGRGPKRALLGLGAIVLVGGLATGGVFFAKSSSATADTVAKFARAPLGCTTTLDFSKADTFTIYVETKGTNADVGGDCESSGKDFEHSGSDVPKVSMTLTDAKGNKIDMSTFTDFSYDTGTYKGASVSQVVIGEPGAYRLEVGSEATDLGVALGGDPDADANSMRLIAIGAAAGGLLVGGALMFLGRPRKGGGVPVVTPTPWQPAAPTAPPAPSAPPAPFGGWQSPPPPTPAPPPTPPSGSGWGAPQQ